MLTQYEHFYPILNLNTDLEFSFKWLKIPPKKLSIDWHEVELAYSWKKVIFSQIKTIFGDKKWRYFLLYFFKLCCSRGYYYVSITKKSSFNKKEMIFWNFPRKLKNRLLLPIYTTYLKIIKIRDVMWPPTAPPPQFY